ncbi:VOC family protein [Brevibacillus ginsengisoli]|uniref:VOC family protein n=1 Tax=Brevibacillus ginsengisoli TaxID=363854 RepID=UPI003CEA120C
MPIAFDHLVHFITASPQQAVNQMSQLGLHSVVGGRHENWGTINALSYFDISYIEFLSLEHPDVAEGAREYGLIDQLLRDLPNGEGMGTIALRTSNIEQAKQHLINQGVQICGPFPGSRKRSDGKVIRWKMLFLRKETAGLPLPFLIEWEQMDEERRSDLTQHHIISSHPAGELKLDYVAFAVNDLDSSIREWRNCFALSAGAPYIQEEWNATCQLLHVTGGNLLFCQPNGEGIVSEVLDTRGERPFLVNLSGAGNPREHQLFGSIYRLIQSNYCKIR